MIRIWIHLPNTDPLTLRPYFDVGHDLMVDHVVYQNYWVRLFYKSK